MTLSPLGVNVYMQIIVALGVLGAAVAKIRLKIVASVRSCKACTGFGIGR